MASLLIVSLLDNAQNYYLVGCVIQKRNSTCNAALFSYYFRNTTKTPKSQSCFLLLLSPPLAGDDGSRDCSTAYFLMMSLHACVTISLLCRIPPYKLFIITAGWFPLNLLLVMVHTNEPRRRPSSPTTTTTLGTMYSSHHQIKSTGSNHFTNQGGH